MIKVSVIVPVYNAGNYIERCINSIINQTLKEIEIIIVNDGSTDKTMEILEKLLEQDERISIVHKENGGVSSARNTGLAMAKGEYIYQLDGDDWIEKETLLNCYCLAKKDNLDIVIFDFLIDYDDGNQIIKNDLESLNYALNRNEYLHLLFLGKSFPGIWNKLFKNSLFNEINYNEELTLGEDMLVTIELVLKSDRIGKLNIPLIHYIQSPNSIVREGISRKIYQLFEVFEIAEKKMKNCKVSEEILNIFDKYKLNHIINFITSEPYWNDEKYILGFNKTLELLKNSSGVPSKMSKVKKVILKFLICYPNERNLSNVINTINKLKQFRKKIQW